jgi:hypothetical protein
VVARYYVLLAGPRARLNMAHGKGRIVADTASLSAVPRFDSLD